HNDVGSFTLYKEGKPFLIDLGVETYTKKTFSEDRYEIWTMQSAYHNTVSFLDGPDNYLLNSSGNPASDVGQSERISTESNVLTESDKTESIAPCGKAFVMQKPGKEYGAKDVICTINEIYSSIRMDIAGAYGDGRIKNYLREVTLFRRESKKDNMCESKNGNTSENKNRDIAAAAQETEDFVLIEDRCEGALPAVLTLMTYEKPFIIENNIEKRKDRLNNNNAIHQRNFGNTSQSNRDSEKLIIAIGDLGLIEAEGIEKISIEACPIKDERLKLAWKHDCYRILLKMKKDSAVIRIC
ncbi:MAG: heparinase II/III family protein, partial [Lachnospiraceae bacterium]|nr:heparinase II/III family protein [Lachnospiraceae bacterium]